MYGIKCIARLYISKLHQWLARRTYCIQKKRMQNKHDTKLYIATFDVKIQATN